MQTTEGMEVKKGNHALRYCKTCEHYKPPRGESSFRTILVDEARGQVG